MSQAASELANLISCLLVTLVPALLLIRLRWPRPPLTQVIRQPGFGACATLVLGTLVIVDLYYLFRFDPGPTVLLPSSSVVMLWFVAGLPPWRPEPSWVDRAGRAAGIAWIVASTLFSLLFWLL